MLRINENKKKHTDHRENPNVFHDAASTGQDTKKSPLAYEERVYRGKKKKLKFLNCETGEKLQPTLTALTHIRDHFFLWIFM